MLDRSGLGSLCICLDFLAWHGMALRWWRLHLGNMVYGIPFC